MNTSSTSITARASRSGRLRLGGLLAALALVFAAGFGASRADAQTSPQLLPGFPALSLSYADAQGPGQATIAPHGPDAATGGTAITLTVSQHTGTFSGPGFVRPLDARGFVLAAAITGEQGDSYFMAGTLARGDDGASWRGRGRWSAVGNPAVFGEWQMADWPVIQPPARPQLATSVRLNPVGNAGVGGVVTLVALPEGETRFELRLAGLVPGRAYGIDLHAGTPAQPSASVTRLATVTADLTGRANASGLVRFRGTEDLPLLAIADGNHFLAVTAAGQTVAVGAIPALQPLG